MQDDSRSELRPRVGVRSSTRWVLLGSRTLHRHGTAREAVAGDRAKQRDPVTVLTKSSIVDAGRAEHAQIGS
jgi:hypothetical protein